MGRRCVLKLGLLFGSEQVGQGLEPGRDQIASDVLEMKPQRPD